MKIELKEISISELVSEYADNQENGVVAYGGKLDVRPPYQREFVYGDKERMAVIDTVMQGFPLNVMYWAVRDDGTYEIIDGQQRTISICQYVNGDFAYMFRYFHNLTQDEQQKILDYKLMVYFCEGTDSEKLKWFETINIAGKELTKQELRNAVYSGSWVSDAKRYFSKNGCVAYQIGGKYLSGSAHSSRVPRNGYCVAFQRQHRGLYEPTSARQKCVGFVAIFPKRHHVGRRHICTYVGASTHHERRRLGRTLRCVSHASN